MLVGYSKIPAPLAFTFPILTMLFPSFHCCPDVLYLSLLNTSQSVVLWILTS